MQKPILTIIILCSFLILGIAFLWLPLWRDFRQARLSIRESQEQLQNKEEYFSKLESLDQELRSRQEEMAKVTAALPSSQNSYDIVVFIEKTASRNGLVVQKMELGAASRVEEGSEIFKTAVDFSLLGPYPAFRSFLAELEKTSRLIEVETIIFSNPTPQGIFTFAFRVITHSY